MVTSVARKVSNVRLVAAGIYAVIVGLIPGALIVTGVALLSTPAAFITAGALLALDKYLPDERE